MRRFIVFHQVPIGEVEVDIPTLKMYDRENLLVLFDELGILYSGNDENFFKSDEECALDGVNDCNGDGDDFYVIGEIVGNELKELVS